MQFRDPERQDYPSLSSFHRYSSCNISYQLSLLAPESKPTKYSVSGTVGHEALADRNYDTSALSQDEIDTVDACREQEDQLVAMVANAPVVEVIREKRIWYSELGERLFSGKPDVVYLLDDPWRTSIIPDYKMGFLSAAPSSVNLQLRGGAVAAWQNYGSRRSFVSIIQPRVAKWAQPALYELDDLMRARDDIKDLMGKIHSPDATANPSAAACRHCAAKLLCKAAWHPSQHIVAQRKDAIMVMNDAELSRFGEMVEQAKIIIEAALEELKDRVMSRPEDFPDWYLQRTGSTSVIKDPISAFASVMDLLSDDPETAKKMFMDMCKPSLTSLVDLVRVHTKQSKKAARAQVERRLGMLLVKEAKSPSLKHATG